jgi:hypothetical protein
MKNLCGAALVLMLGACSTVTIRPSGNIKLTREPNFENQYSFWLWGLVNDHTVDVKQACGKKTPVQLQATDTFVDGLVGVVTFGIYTPRTAKVWCE